jgi:alpha-mannosidase
VKISIKENGPLLASIVVESQAEGCNNLTREVTIITSQPFIEIKNIVDKKAILNKEGIHFGFAFNIDNPTIRADIPWGVMQIDKDQLSGANRNWIGFQRWLDVSNNVKGVTWCSLDAPVFEVGDMRANLLGNSTNSLAWLKKLNPSATIYSWALNNHWYTNFPLSQEGKKEFRYRILPHNSSYDAGLSNRFGLEQAQPLIVSPIKDNVQSSPILSLEGSTNVSVSILKTDSTGSSTLVRFRSVSAKDELVKLNWLSHKPESVTVTNNSGEVLRKEIQDGVLVPAMGFLTLEARFAK